MIIIENKAAKISEVLALWDVEFGDNMVNDICKAAGITDTLVNGEIYIDRDLVYPARTANGVCFKDERKFHGDSYGICYVPHGGITKDNHYHDRNAYCREDLYNLVEMHISKHSLSNSVDQMTEELFEALEGKFPETIIDQWSENLNNE